MHAPMQTWRKILESRPFANFADIKRVFNAADTHEKYNKWKP
jgi:hypothetical protein